jgi:two-component system sensor kinase FixL
MEECKLRELTIGTTVADGMIRVSIADTGTGVAPEVAPQLFQPFVTTKTNGMGIGLSVCRTIVEAHNGRLWMEPNQAGGSVFHFTVHAAAGPEPSEPNV